MLPERCCDVDGVVPKGAGLPGSKEEVEEEDIMRNYTAEEEAMMKSKSGYMYGRYSIRCLLGSGSSVSRRASMRCDAMR